MGDELSGVNRSSAVAMEFVMSAVVSRIDQAGRISISAQQRRAVGLEAGSPIVISVVGNELRIKSMNAAMAELQSEAGQFLQSETASVDAFITQRRSEVEDEQDSAPESSEPESIFEREPELEPEPKAEPDSHQTPDQGSKAKPRSKR